MSRRTWLRVVLLAAAVAFGVLALVGALALDGIGAIVFALAFLAGSWRLTEAALA
jgi:hypothetical protein